MILVVSTTVGALLAVLTGLLIGPNAPFSLKAGPVLASSAILIVLGMIGSLVSHPQGHQRRSDYRDGSRMMFLYKYRTG